ncbi:hypothetical protein [Curtobacterium sp. MCBD17_008]|uniref:hypothetical protein n=1 Tax=Curtobacterium sp. MCBD17_008 TaxID=2175656 RepID=UPI000DA84C74|nr:hypothetical protein [Curtobacterium sp. MCBD17_008]PZE89963.1 hypothetical protein DEI95_13155 [Curtobacterium sp. MCBD17_008]
MSRINRRHLDNAVKALQEAEKLTDDVVDVHARAAMDKTHESIQHLISWLAQAQEALGSHGTEIVDENT